MHSLASSRRALYISCAHAIRTLVSPSEAHSPLMLLSATANRDHSLPHPTIRLFAVIEVVVHRCAISAGTPEVPSIWSVYSHRAHIFHTTYSTEPVCALSFLFCWRARVCRPCLRERQRFLKRKRVFLTEGVSPFHFQSVLRSLRERTCADGIRVTALTVTASASCDGARRPSGREFAVCPSLVFTCRAETFCPRPPVSGHACPHSQPPFLCSHPVFAPFSDLAAAQRRRSVPDHHADPPGADTAPLRAEQRLRCPPGRRLGVETMVNLLSRESARFRLFPCNGLFARVACAHRLKNDWPDLRLYTVALRESSFSCQ